MTIPEYLSQYRTPIPEWLKNYSDGALITFSEIMEDRIGYYPGCGDDGQLIKLCSKSHSVHTFIYSDYLTRRREVKRILKTPNALNGYHLIGQTEFIEKDLLPEGLYPQIITRQPLLDPWPFQTLPFYCIMGIWERDETLSDSWGAERLAVIFLCADAIDYYYQLFVCQYRKAPWIVLLQDHGLGCNYDRFGKGGLLDEIIERSGISPQFVLCGEHTALWDNYMKLECEPSAGGLHHQYRELCKSKTDAEASHKEVWLMTSNPNGDIVLGERLFANMEKKEIAEISNYIARQCGIFEDAISKYVSRIITTELANGETEIRISPNDGESSEFIIVKLGIDSGEDWSGNPIDMPEDVETIDVGRGSKVYALCGYYGDVEGIFSTCWSEDLVEMEIE